MAQISTRGVICVFGQNGYGKTRYVQRILREVPRYVVIEGGFTDEQEFKGAKCATFWDFRDALVRRMGSIFRIRFVPTAQEFPLVCEYIKEARGTMLVIEEADRFIDPLRHKLPAEMGDLIARGRHYTLAGRGVDIVAVAFRPSKIPADLRSQHTELVVFNTSEEADLKWLRGPLGREWAERAAQLPPLSFIHYVKGQGSTLKTLAQIGA